MANGGSEAEAVARALRERVPSVLRALDGTTVEELRLESGGASVTVRRQVIEAPAEAAATEVAAPPPAELAKRAVPGRTEVSASVVGVFHRAREANGAPMAQEGDHVDGNKAIGVIETLGISSDVVSPVGGRLAEFAAQDGQAVEYGALIAVIVPE
ncbi:MAG TPA: biotin/lipoyl-containing protein [Chloroflexota bacterium]|nr:biotin/lipoyl-containing protein [Chloroflexota bacterium]